jgi:dTDP-4-amino-4,6-dideoxygalactose transaminase
LFGLAADLNRIRAIADEHGIILIEDAACSLGATINSRQSGSFGRLGCFSFHPRKSITMGEGGMVVGHDRQDEQFLRASRSHGITAAGRDLKPLPYELGDVEQLGFNYRLTDLQAAVGLAQMDKLDGIIERRRAIAEKYNRAFADLELFSLPVEPPGYAHTYQSYVIRVGAEGCGGNASDDAARLRNEMMLQLETCNIATRPGTHAVHTLAYFRRKYRLHDCSVPNAHRAMMQSIALPLYPAMTPDEIAYVIDNIRNAHAGLLAESRGHLGAAIR